MDNHPERSCGNCKNCGKLCETCREGDKWGYKNKKPSYKYKDVHEEYDKLEKIFNEYGHMMVLEVAASEIAKLKRERNNAR
jgi:NADH:ubiquinone oxidoreductase subunit F (NADH-binding)